MSFEEIDLQWFAAEEEGRTEEPSEYKLRKAREEGRVAKSQELNSAIVMLVTVIVLIIAAPYFWNLCEETLVFYFTHVTETEMLQKRFFFHFIISLAKSATLLVPFPVFRCRLQSLNPKNDKRPKSALSLRLTRDTLSGPSDR